ncbi:hypothetical protein ACHHYP_20386 [Achlya hypogyna]|uniref:Endonuclease/exonuclease/phosphatase domain-containing protein n=1 Tax=Achlya hypogyna TaxID=1202772 RepID=A0A1V9YNT9_ACHHY|nr:hypothetical protein ACHHYP_20386 [Achlya hypogyna]
MRPVEIDRRINHDDLHPISMFSCNFNGISSTAHSLVTKFIVHHSVSVLHDTSFPSARRINNFHNHLSRWCTPNYFLALNDRGQHLDPHETHPAGGVALVFNTSFPGYSTLHHEAALDVLDRYIVVSAIVDDHKTYYHCVYAPVNPQQRAAFYSALPTAFPVRCHHYFFGDFNLPMDRDLDCQNPSNFGWSGHTECLNWLSQLGVVDVWRQLNPTTRLYTGPLNRAEPPIHVNRLDYIFGSLDAFRRYNMQTKYHEGKSRATGDHLHQTIVIHPAVQVSRHPYWRMPRELLDAPEVVTAIVAEARSLRNTYC